MMEWDYAEHSELVSKVYELQSAIERHEITAQSLEQKYKKQLESLEKRIAALENK